MATATDIPWALDKMDREGVARFLTKYLDHSENVKVLNINAPWGTGKTFFLNNWYHSETSNSRACVYFNAWETDFSGDAFVSLVASIRDQLEENIGSARKAKNTLAKFTQKASKTLIAATPAITKGIIKRATYLDLDLLTDKIDEDSIGDAAEKAAERLIQSNKETLKTVSDFKLVFIELLNLAAKNQAKEGDVKPVYIFIDELDRCRPTFAIELLERIKHLFGVPSCKFIIATDTAQLGESVRAVYGAGFASEKYLSRFFDREYTLTIGDYTAWIKSNCAHYTSSTFTTLGMVLKHSTTAMSFRRQHDETYSPPSNEVDFATDSDLSEPQLVILALSKTFNPSLRDLEKIIHHIDAIQSNIEVAEFHFFWAAYLTFLKMEAPALYSKTMNSKSRASISEIAERYTPRAFYFHQTSITVHELFLTYLALHKEGRQFARDQMMSPSNAQLNYVGNAAAAFHNEPVTMRLYPTMVDLAHSIK
ncbi:P-loop ATPase [Pseudomonas putida]|nr:P-loop ATPase [Pseudomonas putida]